MLIFFCLSIWLSPYFTWTSICLEVELKGKEKILCRCIIEEVCGLHVFLHVVHMVGRGIRRSACLDVGPGLQVIPRKGLSLSAYPAWFLVLQSSNQRGVEPHMPSYTLSNSFLFEVGPSLCVLASSTLALICVVTEHTAGLKYWSYNWLNHGPFSLLSDSWPPTLTLCPILAWSPSPAVHSHFLLWSPLWQAHAYQPHVQITWRIQKDLRDLSLPNYAIQTLMLLVTPWTGGVRL